jgi:hypothetical protein
LFAPAFIMLAVAIALVPKATTSSPGPNSLRIALTMTLPMPPPLAVDDANARVVHSATHLMSLLVFEIKNRPGNPFAG